MLCQRCSGLRGELRPPQPAGRVPRGVAGVSCARCGATLGPDDFSAHVVAVLAQLNRFGLTGRDGLLRGGQGSAGGSGGGGQS